MWPWEHAAVGYICYSLLSRRAADRPPSDGAVLVLILGTQFPDIVDKPLAWGVGLLPSGQSLAHSLLFALPALAAVALAATAARRGHLAVAFAVGYFSHLFGDVLYPVVWGDSISVAFLLYPVTEPAPYPGGGLLTRARELATDFVATLATPLGTAYLVAELTLLGIAMALWLLDGLPPLRSLGTRLHRAVTR